MTPTKPRKSCQCASVPSLLAVPLMLYSEMTRGSRFIRRWRITTCTFAANQTLLDVWLPSLMLIPVNRAVCDPSLRFPLIWSGYTACIYSHLVTRVMLARYQEHRSRSQGNGVKCAFIISSVLFAISRLWVIMKHSQRLSVVLRSVSFEDEASLGLPSHTLFLQIRGFLAVQLNRKIQKEEFLLPYCSHCLGTQRRQAKLPTPHLP